MPKQGFKNQWVEVFRVGEHTDSKGSTRKFDRDFLEQVVANFNAEQHEPPAVVGHPEMNAPAFGWVRELRLDGNSLEARFADTNDDFEEMVQKRAFPKRSSSFYLQPPSLRHVGFLGAQPPALKGLREIQFSDGESVTVEISFSEENKMEEKDVQKVADSIWDKMKNWFSNNKPAETNLSAPPQITNFSEADAKKLIDDAVQQVTDKLTAEFNEKQTALETTNKTLLEQVNTISSSGKRAEIVSFVEAIPAESGKHFLKRAGAVEFLESLAVADAADKEPAIVCFSEEANGTKAEHKFSRLEWAKTLFSNLPKMVEFGEKFGGITATAEANKIVDANRVNTMREEMGIKKDGGEK